MSILDNGKPNRPKKPAAPAYKFEPQRDLLFTDLLTEEEKEQIRVEARKDFLEDQKKLARKQFYDAAMEAERRAGDPEEAVVPIFLQLAGSAAYIMIDGKQYFTDTVYHDVPIKRAHVLIEQMTRGWAHEEQTEVRDMKGRRKFRPPPGVGYGNHLDNRLPRHLTFAQNEIDGHIGAMRSTVIG